MSKHTLTTSFAFAFVLHAGVTAAQVRPPVISNAVPYGLQRGTKTTITVDGTNLGEADAVLFSDPGLTARIVQLRRFRRRRADAPEGRHGTTNLRSRAEERRHARSDRGTLRARGPPRVPPANAARDVDGDVAVGRRSRRDRRTRAQRSGRTGRHHHDARHRQRGHLHGRRRGHVPLRGASRPAARHPRHDRRARLAAGSRADARRSGRCGGGVERRLRREP